MLLCSGLKLENFLLTFVFIRTIFQTDLCTQHICRSLSHPRMQSLPEGKAFSSNSQATETKESQWRCFGLHLSAVTSLTSAQTTRTERGNEAEFDLNTTGVKTLLDYELLFPVGCFFLFLFLLISKRWRKENNETCSLSSSCQMAATTCSLWSMWLHG